MSAPISRRLFLRLAAVLATGSAVASCAPAALVSGPAAAGRRALASRLDGGDPPDWLAQLRLLQPPDVLLEQFRQLNRLTYGPTPAERLWVAQNGIHAWIEQQLDHTAIADAACELRLQPLGLLDLSAQEIADLGDKIFDDLDRAAAPAQLRQAALLRQVYSQRQLYEQMVEFWGDHFNISVDKGDCWFLKLVDDREVSRAHALGNFAELLWASAHSPAMLVYLDNQANQRGAPNENYARELLELHTLGIDGGYTQTDIMELARALTGWSVKEHFWRGQFAFTPETHDDGNKTVLGEAIPAAGQAEVEGVLQRLAEHPSTASFVARKLARRFIADDPPAALIERAAAAFTRSRGDIQAALRPLLLDGLAGMQPKYKRPVNFVASALRQIGAQTDGGPALHDALMQMGQLPFAWPNPDGFPDRSAAWQGSLAPRWRFAIQLAGGEIPGSGGMALQAAAGNPAALLDELVTRLLGAPLPKAQTQALLEIFSEDSPEPPALAAGLAAALLASPGFQWR
jgi:uncharacterized protein (DUF1800 family)